MNIFHALNVMLIIDRVDDVELPLVHPKKAFMAGALEKEIRLSFAQRIRGTLPEPYQPLISEAKEKDTPDFKYSSDRVSSRYLSTYLPQTNAFQKHLTPLKLEKSFDFFVPKHPTLKSRSLSTPCKTLPLTRASPMF